MCGLLKSKEEQEERIKKLKPRDTAFDELLLKKINQQIKEEGIRIEENLGKYHKIRCEE